MAFFDLLKGSFTQKLGETYGSTWKGKAIIKAVPFSKAPPTKKQTDNVRAFECLNRLSSTIARIGFLNTGLDASQIHKHNAVAKFLKPVIKNHIFEPSNIKEVIPEGKNIYITALSFNKTTKNLIIGFDLSEKFVTVSGQQVFFIVFDNKGRTYYSRLLNPARFSTSITLDHSADLVYYAIVFLSTPTKKGFILDNFNMMEGLRMAYSYEEQPTGETWLNGKPTFQKSFKVSFNLVNTTSANIDLGIIPNLSAVTKREFVYEGSTNFMGVLVPRDLVSVQVSSGSPANVTNILLFNINANFSTKMVQLQVTSNISNSAGNVYATIWYTK